MIKLIQESAMTLVDSWNDIIENQGNIADIKIDHPMRRFSGDVISKACFGSNYSKGEEIFTKLNALQLALTKTKLATVIPRLRFLFNKYFLGLNGCYIYFCFYSKNMKRL
jgi:cytochrome P450 family 714 subfamily C